MVVACPVVLRTFFSFFAQGSLLVGLWVPYAMLRIETKKSACEASTNLPAVLSFWSLLHYLSVGK